MTTTTTNKPPRLPIPPLKDTLERFIKSTEPLQDDKQNARTKKTIYSPENMDFLLKMSLLRIIQ